jgi:hypothetical protein
LSPAWDADSIRPLTPVGVLVMLAASAICIGTMTDNSRAAANTELKILFLIVNVLLSFETKPKNHALKLVCDFL